MALKFYKVVELTHMGQENKTHLTKKECYLEEK